jgi:hypothetical protein
MRFYVGINPSLSVWTNINQRSGFNTEVIAGYRLTKNIEIEAATGYSYFTAPVVYQNLEDYQNKGGYLKGGPTIYIPMGPFNKIFGAIGLGTRLSYTIVTEQGVFKLDGNYYGPYFKPLGPRQYQVWGAELNVYCMIHTQYWGIKFVSHFNFILNKVQATPPIYYNPGLGYLNLSRKTKAGISIHFILYPFEL